MPRDFRLYLDDILDAIQQIRSYLQGMDVAAFAADRKTQDAVLRWDIVQNRLSPLEVACRRLQESYPEAACPEA